MSDLKLKKKTARRFFNVVEQVAKIDEKIKLLREKQTPGQVSGMGTKAAVLLAREDAIRKLYEDGYTLKQISVAFSDDEFSILPVSLRNILNLRKEAKASTPFKKASRKTVKEKQVVPPVTQQSPPKKAEIGGRQVTQIEDVE
jgi:hypothetical protein